MNGKEGPLFVNSLLKGTPLKEEIKIKTDEMKNDFALSRKKDEFSPKKKGYVLGMKYWRNFLCRNKTVVKAKK